MSDLDETEQKHVRAALRHLHRRLGTWATVAASLNCAEDTIKQTMKTRRPVSASMAFRVARLADVTVDALISGRFLPEGACPHCGLLPDFADEFTITESIMSQ